MGKLKNVESVELLPYHDMGVVKYDMLGIDYPLKNVKQMSKEELKPLYDAVKRGIMKRKEETGE